MKAARREAADIHPTGIFLHSIDEVRRVLEAVVLTDCDRGGLGLDHAEHQKVRDFEWNLAFGHRHGH